MREPYANLGLQRPPTSFDAHAHQLLDVTAKYSCNHRREVDTMPTPRLPTEIKRMKGTLEPSRTNPAEPKPPRGIPEAPTDLSDAAKNEWQRIALILDGMGILTTADQFAMAQLAEAIATYKTAQATIRRRGGNLTYEAEARDGKILVRTYPEVSIMNEADKRIGYWLTRFGMTPADRSRVSVLGDTPQEDYSLFSN